MDNMLLDADGSDASEEVWGDVWDETSRKKRSINLDNMMKDTGDYRMVASMGLQALLTFDPEELDIPKNFHGIPKCLAEILWETEGSTKLCSLIPKSLKNKIRQILMTILRQELSTKFFDVEFYSKFFEQVVKDEETMDDWSKIVQIVQSKYMVPVTSEDLLEIWTIAKTIWTRNVKKVSDSSKKSVLNLVTDLFNAIKEDNVFSKLVVIVRKVQEIAALKKEPISMNPSYDMGPPPDDKLFCQMYANYRMQSSKHKVEVDTAWTRKGKMIFKGEWDYVSGFWFWKKIIKCGCSMEVCAV